MSWAASAYVKKLVVCPNGERLTRSEKALLLVLSDSYNDDAGIAWPSIKNMSRDALLSERQAQRLLHSMARKGVLSTTTRNRQDGGNSSNGYKLLALANGGGDMVSPWGDIAMSPGGCHHVTPILEPPDLELLGNQEENSLTSFESSLGTANGAAVPSPPVDVPDVATHLKQRKPRVIKPIDETDWLWQELQHYTEEFDVDALNDDDWWTNLANSFPVFTQAWVALAFADLAKWLQQTPQRVPRSPRGWKLRMSYSLNRYYDLNQRRQGYVKNARPSHRY